MPTFDGCLLIGAKLTIASHERQRSCRDTARISLGLSMNGGFRSEAHDIDRDLTSPASREGDGEDELLSGCVVRLSDCGNPEISGIVWFGEGMKTEVSGRHEHRRAATWYGISWS